MTKKTYEEDFQFWMPAQVIKSEAGSGKKDGKRWICGIASTADKDLQNEVVEQNGLDISYFLKHGYLNNDHKPGFSNKVGQPTEAKLTKEGLWIKGFLFKNHAVADEIWELMNALDVSGSSRKIGFSIQGKVVKREGNVIKRAFLTDVAVTPSPVNTKTWAEIAKSLNGATWDASSDDEDEEKAITASSAVAQTESLDRDVKDMNKSVSFDDAVASIQLTFGFSRNEASALAMAAFELAKDFEG